MNGSSIKVLFTSGYTRDVVLDKGIEDRQLNFIAKPILTVRGVYLPPQDGKQVMFISLTTAIASGRLRIIILRSIWGTSLIIVLNRGGFLAMMVPQFLFLTQRMMHYPPVRGV